MKKIKKLLIVIVIVAAVLFGIRTYNGYRYNVEKETRFMMDTYVTIYAIGPHNIAAKAIDLALERMQEIDIKFNPLNPASPLYAFNHDARPILDPEILALIKTALEVSKASGGAFDITVAPLLELWGFNTKAYRIPQEQEIKDCLARVGYQHLLFSDGKLDKDNPGTRIDLGGIAKGYALNQAVEVLKANGVVSALVDAGGDVYALGRRGKRLWRVGIKDPRGEGILGYMEVENTALLGSGDYERFFIRAGKRYHHIFDPKTGYPTEGVASVTFICADPVLGQAWTKIPFVLGPEKGLKLLEKIPGLEAIIVTSSGKRLYSRGLSQALKVFPETK